MILVQFLLITGSCSSNDLTAKDISKILCHATNETNPKKYIFEMEDRKFLERGDLWNLYHFAKIKFNGGKIRSQTLERMIEDIWEQKRKYMNENDKDASCVHAGELLEQEEKAVKAAQKKKNRKRNKKPPTIVNEVQDMPESTEVTVVYAKLNEQVVSSDSDQRTDFVGEKCVSLEEENQRLRDKLEKMEAHMKAMKVANERRLKVSEENASKLELEKKKCILTLDYVFQFNSKRWVESEKMEKGVQNPFTNWL